MRGDDRAVSEVLGFVLVFGIIIGSVALLAFVGFNAMTTYQEGEQLRNAERGMVSLGDNFNDVVRYDAIDERSGELALREGTITTGSGGASVTVDGTEIEDQSLGTFEYSIDSREDTIAYEGGGVFRGDSSGSVAISDPPVRCYEAADGDQVAIISLVAVEAADQSLMSSEVQEFTAVKRSSTVESVDGVVTLEFEEESPNYQDGWDRTLENNGWTKSGNQFTCTADRALIQVVEINIEY